VFPQLRKLEEKYTKELVVIGVHSAKFDTEKITANIRQAVLKNDIHHPVVNDAGMQIWRAYGVQAWPTCVIIDPMGKVIGGQSGEQIYDLFDQVIGGVITEFDRRGLLSRRTIEFEREQQPGGLLKFPGKVIADVKGGRLFISDSNHNRILVTTFDGEVKEVIGSGKLGRKDGAFEQAEFEKQQGMALDGDYLYIADTENHALRVADLKARTVSTVCGNGRQGFPHELPAKADVARMNSPWDVAIVGDKVFVAMAGTHQIWAVDRKTEVVTVHAGSGREGLQDSTLTLAWLAQPSGLCTDGINLYFADAEVSAVRMASVARTGRVQTLVGHDLFVWGDKDGVGDEVRMQHTLGICIGDNMLYVADGYNHKIKRLDPRTRRCDTVVGTGQPGATPNQLDEPTGVAYANGKLYIADTNNHRIQVFDLATKTATTLNVRGVK